MNYINRSIEKEIIKLSNSFPAIVITGPRQVGKTTMLRFLSDNMDKKLNYVSLDNLKDRALAIQDPELFLEMYQSPLIIEEFQYAPNLLSYIKIEIDNKRLDSLKNNNNNNGMYFLTGSQSFLSMKEVTESLAGRIAIVNLYGLSSREINKEPNNLFIPEVSS